MYICSSREPSAFLFEHSGGANGLDFEKNNKKMNYISEDRTWKKKSQIHCRTDYETKIIFEKDTFETSTNHNKDWTWYTGNVRSSVCVYLKFWAE